MIDFDALYDESERTYQERERKGIPQPICPHCEIDAAETGDYRHIAVPLIPCWCGVCLKYHHGDDGHEPMDDYFEAEGVLIGPYGEPAP